MEFCEHLVIEALQETQVREVAEDRIADLMAAAAGYFEDVLWESPSGSAARDLLAAEGLEEETIRAFGVGYAPIGPDELMEHLQGLGYSTEELVRAGLVHRSVRGRPHAHFRSRLTFPVSDREGRVLGFAGLATHVGPSWALWVASPDTDVYRRSEAVFGLYQAAEEIAASGAASVKRNAIEVMKAHQRGEKSAVTVQSSGVTYEQLVTLAAEVPGGVEALRLDLPRGMPVDTQPEEPLPTPIVHRDDGTAKAAEAEGGRLHLKRIAIVIGTALATINLWTGAPLLAIWIGAQAQGGRVLNLRGVLTVVVVLGVMAFLLGWALTWLNAKYDELIGRPPTLARTSPWQRRMRGELDEHLRTRYSLSAPERVVAACVIAGFLAFEIWFLFFAGSSLPS